MTFLLNQTMEKLTIQMQSAKTKSTKVAGNSLKTEKEFYGGNETPVLLGMQLNGRATCLACVWPWVPCLAPQERKWLREEGMRGRAGSREAKKEAQGSLSRVSFYTTIEFPH